MFGLGPPRLAAAESSSTARACVRKVELIGDVDKNGGATREMRPLVTSRRRRDRNCFTSMVEASSKGGQEVRGEIFGIIMGVLRERSAAALRVK